jgi:hypothetical protein
MVAVALLTMAIRASVSCHLALYFVSATYAVLLNLSYAKAYHGDRPFVFPDPYSRDKDLGPFVNMQPIRAPVGSFPPPLHRLPLGPHEHRVVSLASSKHTLEDQNGDI